MEANNESILKERNIGNAGATEITCPETPFENIALAFSGGGFRAASFSLGVMSYFNHISFNGDTLLKKVKYISSASGGTYTAALYALYNSRGEDFDKMYRKLCSAMNNQELLEKALSILNDEKAWVNRPEKSRNLINAFSMAYDTELLFDGATIEPLITAGKLNSHLDEVCFNSTEFYKGHTFKQQVKLKDEPKGFKDDYFLFGGHYAYLGSANDIGNIVPKLKLADVLAASSCFPAGFEPFIYPHDFSYGTEHNPGLDIKDLKGDLKLVIQSNSAKEKSLRQEQTFGLMDGGVDDNQSLNSLMDADESRQKKYTSFKRFDFIMVNDVASFFMDGYEPPQKQTDSFWKNLNFSTVKYILFSLFGISLLCLGVLFCIMIYFPYVGGGVKLGLGVIGALLLGITVIPLLIYDFVLEKLTETNDDGDSKGASKLSLEDNFSPEIIKSLSLYFDKTKLGVLAQMMGSRIDSVLTLNNDVFLKRIRRIIYEIFYESPKWEWRRKGNYIYDLSRTNNINRHFRIADNLKKGIYNQTQLDMLEPTDLIQDVADIAFGMGTTLWFGKDNNHTMKNIIACGQFTTCYNLLGYVYSIQNKFPQLHTELMKNMQEQLERDWNNFKLDPFKIYK